MTTKPILDPQILAARSDTTERFHYQLLRHPAAFAAHFFDYEIEPYQAEILNFARRHTHALILVPAQHGKSTLIAKVLPILEICTNPNVRIILIMKTENDVSAYSSSIRNILATDRKLIDAYGPFKPEDKDQPWSSVGLNVAKRQIADEHYTLEFFGAGGPVLGHRCDIVIMDDVVTEKNSKTAEMRQSYLHWFRESVQTGPKPLWGIDEKGVPKVPKGTYWPTDILYNRVLVCGTRFHPRDLYYELEHDPQFQLRYFDCFLDKTEEKPLWPKGMSVAKLKAERASLGPLSFNKRYRNIAYDESEMAFQRPYIYGGRWQNVEFPGCLDEGRSFGEIEPSTMKVLGFDPASGKGTKKATWPSYIVLGCNPTEEDPNIYLLDLFRRQMGIEDQIDVLLYGNKSKGLPGFYAQYAYDAAIVEENGYQNAILALERVQAAREKGVIIQGHYTTGEKQDPEWGVRGMEKMMMDGTFRIPARLPSDLAKASDLIDQLLLFPKGVYDYCMALWFAWRFIKRHTSSKYHSFYRPGFGGDLVPVPGRDPTTDQDAGRGQYRRPLYTPKLPRNRLLGL